MITTIRRRLMDMNDTTVTLLLLTFFIGAVIGSRISHMQISQGSDWAAWWDAIFQNFGAEMLGALLVFLLIEILVGHRRERELLIRDMGSRDNATALRAVRELRAHGWLVDGLLRGIILIRSDLQEGRLDYADLKKADLSMANMRGIRLWRTNLEGASLQGADLADADLREAVLKGADFLEANLMNAITDDATLQNSSFDKNTRLPDGTYWTLVTDMARFTDPTHRHFWRSNNHRSPAYKNCS